MVESCISITIELGTTILASVVIIGILAYLLLQSRMKNTDFELDSCELGLSGNTIHLKCNKKYREIAYKLWVDINTRAIGVKIDFDQDIIYTINKSYYESFKGTRELLKEMPVNKLCSDSDDLVNLIVRFLNEVMRPYLTKWGIKYNKWYETEINKEDNNTLSPVDIQKKYEYYNELVADLQALNNRVMAYSDNLQEIAFNLRKK